METGINSPCPTSSASNLLSVQRVTSRSIQPLRALDPIQARVGSLLYRLWRIWQRELADPNDGKLILGLAILHSGYRLELQLT
jgi:hypothetical protein